MGAALAVRGGLEGAEAVMGHRGRRTVLEPVTSAAARVVHRAAAASVAVALLALGFVAARAGAQETTGWVAVQVYNCPPGMTAESLDPWACWVAPDGVEVQLWTPDGTPLLSSGDAYFDGWTWTWAWLPVGSPGEAYPYHVVQTAAPAGSWGSVILYAMAEGDGSVIWLSSDAPGADLHIYNFIS
jgi:hypothetical protein